jgi:hypothetical protein
VYSLRSLATSGRLQRPHTRVASSLIRVPPGSERSCGTKPGEYPRLAPARGSTSPSAGTAAPAGRRNRLREPTAPEPRRDERNARAPCVPLAGREGLCWVRCPR